MTQMQLQADWIVAPATRRVAAALTDAGYRSLFVGGCVRDTLLERPVGDIDIATEALPEQVIAAAEAAGLRAVPTGIAHGTVTLVADGLPFEVTTFRRDLETDGRHAVVGFTTDIAEDAARRDFTMNALYADADGTVIDPLGGLPDLLARRVRFVGDPAQRIAEDSLRILRFFRFFAWYGNPDEGIDPESLAACTELQAGLERLSRERVGAELRRLLAAPDPTPSVATMAATGILAQLLPGADPIALGPLVHLEQEGGIPARWQRRLLSLGAGDTVDRSMRLSRAELQDLRLAKEALAADATPAARAWRYGLDPARDAILIHAASLGVPLSTEDFIRLEADLARGAASRMPVRASDLGLEGKTLGAALRRIEAAWCASDLRADAATLLATARD